MKTYILIVLVLFCLNFCYAQNVGISRPAPTEKLHVDSGNIKIGNAVWSTGLDRFLKFGDGDFVRIGEASSDDYMYLYAKNFIILPSLGGYPGSVGIGTTTPSQKLDVNGTIRSNALMLTTGSTSEVLKKGTGDNIVFQKGHNGLGINYIIALQGIYPSSGGGGGSYSDLILGEIRLFAGNFAPTGFALCQGQLMSIASNTALFSLLGTIYGGDGMTTFALPDLRAAVPVGQGTTGTGPSWILGERSN